MKKSDKDSSGSSVGRQFINSRTKKATDLTSLDLSRVSRSISDTGQPTLFAIFPRSGGKAPQSVNISFLLQFPNLEPIFSKAISIRGAPLSALSRVEMVGELHRGLFAYLKEKKYFNLLPSDLDDEFFIALSAYIRNQKNRNGKNISDSSVRNRINSPRNVLSGFEEGAFSTVASLIAEAVPLNTKINRAPKDQNPTELIDFDHFLQILEAAEREILASDEKYYASQNILTHARAALRKLKTQPTRRDYLRREIAIAVLDKIYPACVPGYRIIAEKDRALSAAVKRFHGGISEVFQPRAREMVPFAILLATCTFFNPDTVLTTGWSGIDLNAEQLGDPAIKISSLKPRAGAVQTVLIDANPYDSIALSIDRALDILNRITLRIRPAVDNMHSDRIFIYVPEGQVHSKSFGGLGGIYGASQDINWQHVLKQFISDNKLKKFTLGQIRPTLLEWTQHSTGFLDDAKKAAQHSSSVTTWTHYTSDAIRKKYREQVGMILLVKERWLNSNGAIDPRDRLHPGGYAAATPGFGCLDPFDSPRPSQEKGKICRDYGACPGCEMACAYPDDPQSAAYYIGLEEALYISVSSMSSATWLKCWAPILAALQQLIKIIPRAIRIAADKIKVTMPKVG
ncbi:MULTISPECIES: hypothetical protein [unclassified Variovorax]|jgi:hypothetical protein|uniref:hypothetical protein n=2 Tax=Comamonadaceae TaxID=80864 RepID=UPI000B1BEA4C|nr:MULTISPECIES: hypothetical protein [unclassified Variovorax]